jgi:hypothetical protein
MSHVPHYAMYTRREGQYTVDPVTDVDMGRGLQERSQQLVSLNSNDDQQRRCKFYLCAHAKEKAGWSIGWCVGFPVVLAWMWVVGGCQGSRGTAVLRFTAMVDSQNDASATVLAL